MYEELVERLKRCSYSDPNGCEECRDCPNADNFYECKQKLALQAADAIVELSKDLERSKEWETFWEKEANEALKKFQTTVASIPRWIPVTERLPEKRKWVLCWCVSNSQEVLRWENNEWYHDPNHVYFSDLVTHWMPLPEPPKEE